MKKFTKRRKAGFSLIEVTLALGVAGFCLLAIFGLLPVGLNSNRIAVEQSEAANIATNILSDLQSAPKISTEVPSPVSPRFKFPMPTPTGAITTYVKSTVQILYFDRNGTPLGTVGASPGASTATGPDAPGAPFFRASVGYAPPAIKFSPAPVNNAGDPGTYVKGATMARINITWPASDRKTTWPTSFSGSFETVTALNRN